MNSNVDIRGDLVINGNLQVFQQNSTSIINTTVNEYELIVTNDISLNGNLYVHQNASFNGNVEFKQNSIALNAIDATIGIPLTIGKITDANIGIIHQDISAIYFDTDSGFDVSAMDTGEVVIKMNSTFKFWDLSDNVPDGATNENMNGLVAQGLDQMNFVVGDNIEINLFTSGSGNDTVNYFEIGSTTDISINGLLKVNGDVSFNSKLSIGGDVSMNNNLDITGKISHNGLAITSGTEIDQIKTFTNTLSISPDEWTNTDISGSDLTTGIYFLTININDTAYGGTHQSVTYTGTISWYEGSVTSDTNDEILLHRSGIDSDDGTIYVRTIASAGSLQLQIYSNKNITNYPYVFKFRRFM